MKIKFSDGSKTIERLVRDVESITFEEAEPLTIGEFSVPSESVTNVSARIEFSILGYYDERSKVGVMYSDKKDVVEAAETADISGNITGSTMFFELADLQQQTTYYYKLYVQNEGFDRFYTEVSEFTTTDKPAVPEFVDLGLSVKWATRNIGAPEGVTAHYGGHYVWGDPTGEMTLSSNLNYLYDLKDDAGNSISNISGTKYDIATQQWGEGWRIPTKAELEELSSLPVERIDNYENTGIGGFEFTGKNGKKIFFPSSGSQNLTGVHGEYQHTYYWSSEKTLDRSNVYYATVSYGGATIRETKYDIIMFAIRPVYDGEDPKEHEGETEAGKQVKRVKLGFDIDWSDRNIGASSGSEYGKYYAWGETDDKSDYQLSTYKWLNDGWLEDITNAYKFIGYDIKNTEYDVAANELGGNWRMPTSDEMRELIDRCQWTWTYRDGTAGYLVTRSGYSDSMFLPAGGFMNGTVNANKGTDVCYWTSSMHNVRDDVAFDLEMRREDGKIEPVVSHVSRSRGLLIRPVRDRK